MNSLPQWDDQPDANQARYLQQAEMLMERGYVSSDDYSNLESLAKAIFDSKMKRMHEQRKTIRLEERRNRFKD